MSLLSSADVSISLNFHLICRFFTPPLLAPLVSCNVPPLFQLNVASIHCKALKTIEIHCKARTSNVSTCCQFFRLLARDQPIVLKSHMDLFANHFWICSLAVWAFVPNRLWTWVLIGRADLPHSRPHICCSVGSIFLNGQGLAAHSQCAPVEGEGGGCQVMANRSFHSLCMYLLALRGQTCYQCQICNRWSRTCICSQNIASMLPYTLALCSSRP